MTRIHSISEERQEIKRDCHLFPTTLTDARNASDIKESFVHYNEIMTSCEVINQRFHIPTRPCNSIMTFNAKLYYSERIILMNHVLIIWSFGYWNTPSFEHSHPPCKFLLIERLLIEILLTR